MSLPDLLALAELVLQPQLLLAGQIWQPLLQRRRHEFHSHRHRHRRHRTHAFLFELAFGLEKGTLGLIGSDPKICPAKTKASQNFGIAFGWVPNFGCQNLGKNFGIELFRDLAKLWS